MICVILDDFGLIHICVVLDQPGVIGANGFEAENSFVAQTGAENPCFG